MQNENLVASKENAILSFKQQRNKQSQSWLKIVHKKENSPGRRLRTASHLLHLMGTECSCFGSHELSHSCLLDKGLLSHKKMTNSSLAFLNEKRHPKVLVHAARKYL